ncbi:MAG: 4Fe-4S dicluster domain-containing protein [Deltaproteobacteria bacterium]|nr:4Fe-4S dicluster domain-containing protein [Deltaproteobacteria bacterium]
MAESNPQTFLDPGFRAEVDKRSGTPVSACFHCIKCTNGCPISYAMDIVPNRLMRMIQLGLRHRVLSSSTIWICASCETCTTRCPNDIDVARVMDSLRQMSLKAGTVAEPQIPMFHEAFLAVVKSTGRVHELEMLVRYKLKSGNLLSDVRLGWEMFKRGRLKLIPDNIARLHEVRRIFEEEERNSGA